MFTKIDKAIVALAMAVAFLLNNSGVAVPEWFTEEWVTNTLAILAPIAVWLVPNKTDGDTNAPT